MSFGKALPGSHPEKALNIFSTRVDFKIYTIVVLEKRYKIGIYWNMHY